ncbi:MAG: hypothetical protein JW822_09830 [Spirochaetales bacterium]|nr:hypothetical protein [Spirochaetales bacterium]
MSKRLKDPSASEVRVYKELKEFLFTAVVSALLGALVALPFVYLFEDNLFIGMLKGCGAGAVIGIISRIVFTIVLRTVHSRTLWAFLCIFFTIGSGTLASSYLFGLTEIFFLFLITGLAEVVGLSVTFFIYRYSLYLNSKLHAVQEKIQVKVNKKHT